jgi:hypothetical protein
VIVLSNGVPRSLKLVQGTSDRGKLPKGVGIGDFVLGEDKLEQPKPVIPIASWISRQMWDPNPENAKMLCNSPDGTVGWQFGECKVCPHGKFDEAANRSACNKTSDCSGYLQGPERDVHCELLQDQLHERCGLARSDA